MSDPYSPYQSPSPYPNYYAQPPQAPAGRNRSASLAALMLVAVVALYVIQSAVSIYYYGTAPVSEYVPAPQEAQFRELNLSREAVRTMYTVLVGSCTGIIVLLLLVLAPFVKKGGKGATITTLVIMGILALFSLLGLLSGIVQISGALAGPDVPELATWFVATSLVLGVLTLLAQALLIVFLARSLSERARLMQQQIEGSMTAQQAAWQGYYGQQPPQPPPPPPPPQDWGGPPNT